MVLAESLVDADTGVRPRPLGLSSEERASSTDNLSGTGEGWETGGADVSELTFRSSTDGRDIGLLGFWTSSVLSFAEELAGLVGGEGGGLAWTGRTLLGGTVGCSHWKDACGICSSEDPAR